MSTTSTGRDAEDAAGQYLVKLGYAILAQNWRTRWCEIDIIAKKANTIYFVEVKYRKSHSWGDGLDAITPKKLQQMTFAAEMWVQEHAWSEDYRLVAISTTGIPPSVVSLLEID